MKIPKLLLPILVVVAIFGGWTMRALFLKPTTDVIFDGIPSARMECTVNGVKCKGTASFFTSLYKLEPGIASITTYASEHKAIIEFDPRLTDAEHIKEVMEAPIPLRDGTSQQVFECVSMTITTDHSE